MSTFKKGEIYYAEDPAATGSEQRFLRPHVIMSRSELNGTNTVVAIPFTTKDKGHPAYCIRIPSTEIILDPLFMGQVQDSVARCYQVRVMDKSRFKQKIGKLSSTAVAAIELGLTYLFDLR
jgi:mRNA interferase MazF